MYAILKKEVVFILIICLGFLFSCKSIDPELKPSKNLSIEEEVEVASESVPSSGGTVVVESPGSEIDEMEIFVPSGSYSSSRTFKITTATITSHELGEYFNPITPLIQIENGSGYADSIMEITIPISIKEGEIPLGFFYDEITGKLEAIPIKSYTKNSITLLTRHFMSASELRGDDDGLKGVNIDATSNMVISSLQESRLKNQNIISSGFKTGIDDWEFVNYGSYLSSGGHCAGQSMTSMWYYYEKKLKGEQALFHRFDKINEKLQPEKMWFDNGVGYRFASVIQEDLNFTGWLLSLDMQSYIPSLVFKYFAAAILVTGEPQAVLINSSAGKGGHAMIVYKVNLSEEKLYIADPNYPNNIDPVSGAESVRVIELIDGKLKPYETGLTAGASSVTMDQIGFAGKTAYIEWPQIGKRYNEVTDSTIGNIAPNNFPKHTFLVKGKEYKKLADGFTSDTDTLRCAVECNADLTFSRNGKKLIRFAICNDKGELISRWEGGGLGYTLLKPGINKIGIYAYAQMTDKFDSNGNYLDLFVDFKWFDVYYTKLTIDPNPIAGEPAEKIKIVAKLGTPPPAKSKYVWKFGDGSKEETIKNDSVVNHTFKTAGIYNVSVDVYDDSKDLLIGQASAQAKIGTKGFELVIKNNENGDIIENNAEACEGLILDFKIPASSGAKYLVYDTDEGDPLFKYYFDAGYNIIHFKRYMNPGLFKFEAKIFNENDQVIEELSRDLTIVENSIINDLKKSLRVYARVYPISTKHSFDDGTTIGLGGGMFSFGRWDVTPPVGAMKWSGNSFTFNHIVKADDDLYSKEVKIEGTLSPTGWMIETFKAYYKDSHYECSVETTNIPIFGNSHCGSADDYYYSMEGSDIGPKLNMKGTKFSGGKNSNYVSSDFTDGDGCSFSVHFDTKIE